MRIDNNGNVNIGTTAQSFKLYVNGTTYFNDVSTINGLLTVNNSININGTGPCSLYFKSANYNIGIANAVNEYATNSGAGDMVIRTITGKKLILQSGDLAGNAIVINSANNVGIGTFNPTAKLHIEHSSTSVSPDSGGIYVYNPTNAADNTSIIGTRIGGTNASKALFSLDVNQGYGWSMFIAGSDTTDRYLRFNPDWRGSATNDALKLAYNGNAIISGNVGIGTVPTETLNLYTLGIVNAFIKADAGGGTGQAGLRLFAGNNTSNRATRIDFFNNVASTTVPRWSILNDTDQNGTNDLRIFSYNPNANNVFTILQNGNVGIGITNPNTLLHLRGAKPATLKIETNNNAIGEVCCIEFGIPAFSSSRCAKITSTTYGGNKADIQFLTSPEAITTNSSVRMTIKEDGNVGIGSNSPNNILQVGDGARLRI
jgi:hypothetical protein